MLDLCAQGTLGRSVSIAPSSNRAGGHRVEVVGHSEKVLAANLLVALLVWVEALAERSRLRLEEVVELALVDSAKGRSLTLLH